MKFSPKENYKLLSKLCFDISPLFITLWLPWLIANSYTISLVTVFWILMSSWKKITLYRKYPFLQFQCKVPLSPLIASFTFSCKLSIFIITWGRAIFIFTFWVVVQQVIYIDTIIVENDLRFFTSSTFLSDADPLRIFTLATLQVIFSALRPLTCNSTQPQHTLQMFTDHFGPRQAIPWETINQGLLQPQGELYPIQTIFSHRSWDQLLEFCTSFYETISSEFLVQGNFKHTQFSREHWNWWDLNSQPLSPKSSAVSIELTWLLTLKQVQHIIISLWWFLYPLHVVVYSADISLSMWNVHIVTFEQAMWVLKIA